MIAYGVGKTDGAFVGGHVNNLMTIGKQLVSKGHDVDVITIPPVQSSDSESKKTEYSGVSVYTVEIPETLSASDASEEGNITLRRGAIGLPQILSKLRERNRIMNYDVVHGHSGYPWVGLIPEISKVFTSATTIHTLYCPVDDRGIGYSVASSLSLEFCDHVVGISENVSNSIPSYTGVDVSTIPPLVDHKRFSNHDSAKHSDEFEILYLGNLSESKGIRTLITALSIINEQIEFRLYLALDMTVEEYHQIESDVKQMITNNGLEDNIEPVGIVEDLPGLMSSCDAFVAPFNDTQGPADYPVAMLEAMACGLPVVASTVGGIPEVITDYESGLLVEPGNHEMVADRIVELANNESLRNELSEAGPAVVKSISEGIVDRYFDIYDNHA